MSITGSVASGAVRLGAPPARRDHGQSRSARCRARRELLPRGLALAEELGMRPLVAHCHLGLGKLYRRTGDGAKAQEHLTTASDDVPRDGHALLAGEGGRGAGWSRAMTRVMSMVMFSSRLSPRRSPPRRSRRGTFTESAAWTRVPHPRALISGRHSGWDSERLARSRGRTSPSNAAGRRREPSRCPIWPPNSFGSTSM